MGLAIWAAMLVPVLLSPGVVAACDCDKKSACAEMASATRVIQGQVTASHPTSDGIDYPFHIFESYIGGLPKDVGITLKTKSGDCQQVTLTPGQLYLLSVNDVPGGFKPLECAYSDTWANVPSSYSSALVAGSLPECASGTGYGGQQEKEQLQHSSAQAKDQAGIDADSNKAVASAQSSSANTDDDVTKMLLEAQAAANAQPAAQPASGPYHADDRDAQANSKSQGASTPDHSGHTETAPTNIDKPARDSESDNTNGSKGEADSPGHEGTDTSSSSSSSNTGEKAGNSAQSASTSNIKVHTDLEVLLDALDDTDTTETKTTERSTTSTRATPTTSSSAKVTEVHAHAEAVVYDGASNTEEGAGKVSASSPSVCNNGDVVVPDGWTGQGAAVGNHCNTCICVEGVLACTKAVCRGDNV